MSGVGAAEGEGEADFPLSGEPDAGLNPRILSGRQMLNQLSQPGALFPTLKKYILFICLRERKREGRGGGAEGENPKLRVEPFAKLDLMTWRSRPEPKSRVRGSTD